MIHVERDAAPEARAALAKADKWGLNELDYALWWFNGHQPVKNPLPTAPGKAPGFKAYKSKAVKDALNAMFGNRCAYCESVYGHLMPMDVEHYRPKSGYLNEAGKLEPPGYYWLASDWENLLPSCADCNRERKQVHQGADNRLVEAKSGKANKFPLAPNSPRAGGPGDQAAETPLLLDPCSSDDPAQHLHFLSGGFVEPALTPEEKSVAKGRTTIEVCGLDRNDLVGTRRDWAIRVMGAMKAVLVADLSLRKLPGDPDFLAHRAEAEDSLEDLVTKGAQYRAMTTAMEETFEKVRPLIDVYQAAKAAWVQIQDAARTAALETEVGKIVALLSAPGTDRELVVGLLGYGGIDPEKLK